MIDKVIFGRAITVVAYPILLAYASLLMSLCVRSARRWKLTASRKCGPKDLDIGMHKASLETAVQIERETKHKSSAQRAFYCRRLVNVSMHLGAWILFYFTIIRHQRGVWSHDYAGQKPSENGSMFVILVTVAGMIIQLVPDRLTLRFTDGVHVALMVWVIWRTVAAESIYSMVFRSRGLTPIRLALGCWFGNPFLTMVLNSVFCISSSWAYVTASRGDTDEPGKFDKGHAMWYVFDDVTLSIVISVTAYAIEARCVDELRAQVKLRISSRVADTLNTLLMALCDAVVRLSPTFEILVGSATLQTLLLKGTRDASFLDVLEPADRERFLDHCAMSHSPDSSSHALSLHVGMRDASGVLVKVQLYSVSLLDVDRGYLSCNEYLLGIRELSREEHEMVPELSKGSGTSCAPAPRDIAWEYEHPSILLRSSASSNDGASSASGNGSLQRMPGVGDLTEVVMVCDVLEFVIQDASPAFTLIGGPSTIGACFLEWLCPIHSAPAAFGAFVQDMVNGITHGHVDDAPHDFGEVRLRPPIAVQAQLEYFARCNLELVAGSDDTIDNISVRVVLTDFAQRRCKNSTHRRVSPAPAQISSTLVAL